MAQDTKFGTFGGVFTPSILTILGVIMYLRLPRVVGNAGLPYALGIVAVAHVVSVATGLSISSIATDKKVGAGGPYYIISRSLGLPIGGTLGLALFIGLSFSISLYIIGFSESFLAFWDIPVDKTSIRICGSVTMLALTILTLISTALAIKTQYLILTAIVLSLVSIFLGGHPDGAPAAAVMNPAPGGEPLAAVFGIFFPAVTGFTAGVNMSGDLRDPKKSIPSGTIAAVAVGLVVYVALSVFLAVRVPRQALLEDGEVLLHLALFPPAVVAGIWGATLSSALGSILGAPRILQAVAGDGIVWRWFARGTGPSNEPRNALLLAFVIGEGGILYGELDGIARVVSMVFLATYGFLNVTCAIESWVSPDFRPDFRIPKAVSVVGAGVCALLMIQLDLMYMAVSIGVLGAVFFWLSRKQLTLEAGDAWEGVWSSLVRSGLWRLSREEPRARMWRPHILAFRSEDPAARARLRSTAAALITGSGLLTDIELEGYGAGDEDELDADAAPLTSDEDDVGVFAERLPAGDPFRTVADVCRHRGVTGLSPNTVLLDWLSFRRDPEPFGELLDQITQLDHNLLVSAPGAREEPAAERVDLWWAPGAGNANLAVGLTKFFTRHQAYAGVELRFLLVSNDSSSNDHLRSIMRSLLTEARIQATIRIVNDTLRSGDVFEYVTKESADARLVVVGLPIDADQAGPAYQARVDALCTSLAGELLLMRSASGFAEVLRLSRQATISFIPPSEGGQRAALPELELPELPELASAVTRIVDGYQRLASRLHKGGMQRVYGREVKLLRRLKKAVSRRFAGLEKGLAGTNPRRLRNLVNRTQSSLLNDLAELLADFAEQGLEAQRGALDARVQGFLDGRGVADHDPHRVLTVRWDRSAFETREGDGPRLRRFKAWRRFWSRGNGITIQVPLGRLQRFYFEEAIDQVLSPAVRQYVTDSHNLMVHLGKTLASLRMATVLLGDEEVPDEDRLRARVGDVKSHLLAALDDLIDHNKRRIGHHQWSTLEASRTVVQRLAVDLDRIDVRALARDRRRVDRGAAEERREALTRLPERWFDHQQLVVERARLGLRLAAFQHRFASTVTREKQAIVLAIRSGALGECERFLTGLRNLRGQLAGHEDADDDAPLVIAFDTRADLDERFDLEQTLRSLVNATADLANELPAHVTTLTDASIKHLEEGETDDVETTEVPVMRLVQFLVEARFVGVVQAALEQVPKLEARASGVAQDAVRLVTFQLSELGAEGEEAASVADQLGPVVDRGIERLEQEIAQLDEALDQVVATIDEQLGVVLDGTNAYDLTATASDLDQQLRRHQGEMAAAGARSFLRQTRERLRSALVRLVYRRSAGLLLARELRERDAGPGKLVDRVLAQVQRHQPHPEVLDDLPAYYRRLFYGQATISETFWVGRERQLAQAKRVIATFGRGASGALVVVGERGSGKTSLVQRIATELLARRPIYRIAAPREGAAAPGAFGEALRRAVLGEGTAEEMLQLLPDDPVIVLDDFELWWERRDGGFAAVEEIYELIEKVGDRVLFVLAMSQQAYRFIDRFCPLSDEALAVLECTPVDAEALQSIVMLRHGSTGLTFEVDGRPEEQLSELRLARFFSHHFDYSGGHVGAALHAWISHVRRVAGTTLQVEAPNSERWDLLDGLRPAHKALLTQLVLHKVVQRAALERITGIERRRIDHDVDTLVRMGLVVESRAHGLSINPFVHHAVVRRLSERGVLP